jgi:RNA polymerase sigma-70 factor, ECF subfamily
VASSARLRVVPRPNGALDQRASGWYLTGLVTVETEPAARAKPADDAELVEQMARGHVAALSALYDRYAQPLLGLAQRIAGGRSEGEDIVHDVFLEAWRHAADYDCARGSVKGWLFLRTRSRALDFRKSAAVSRSVSASDGAWLGLLADPRDDSEAPDRARIRRVLGGLSAEQREVLLLGYFEGLSSSEIAARVDAPIGTVKSRVAAALAALRSALADSGVSP